MSVTKIYNSTTQQWEPLSFGLQGARGLQGLQGLQGASIQGLQGIQGIKGFQGIQGTKGLQGIQGPEGTAGAFYCEFNNNTMNVSGSVIYDNYSAGKSVYCKVIDYDEKYNVITGGLAGQGNDLILHLETCIYVANNPYVKGYIRFSGYRYYLDIHDFQQYEYIELEGSCDSNSTWTWSLHNPVLALPSIEDQNNKILSVNANANGLQWITNSGGGGSSLPSQTGHSGEYLTTNGTDASWQAVCLINLYN